MNPTPRAPLLPPPLPGLRDLRSFIDGRSRVYRPIVRDDPLGAATGPSRPESRGYRGFHRRGVDGCNVFEAQRPAGRTGLRPRCGTCSSVLAVAQLPNSSARRVLRAFVRNVLMRLSRDFYTGQCGGWAWRRRFISKSNPFL